MKGGEDGRASSVALRLFVSCNIKFTLYSVRECGIPSVCKSICLYPVQLCCATLTNSRTHQSTAFSQSKDSAE